ncbi:MAG: RNA polymerase sigma factor [Verrucomicrobiales bacterium]
MGFLPDDVPDPAAPVDGQFLTTRWSIVLGAGDSSGPDAQRRALEQLCHDYWYPLYAFLRRSGKSQVDAEDLTQGFFERFLTREDFKRATPERGRFRSYLLTSLKNYVASEWHKENAVKRGGGSSVFPIDADLERRYGCEPSHGVTPETLYEKSWANAIIARVLAKLSQEFAAAGKSGLFDSLRGHLGGAKGSDSNYAAVAESHGMSVGAVTMAVRRMRARYGELLRRDIAETVSSADEVDDEIRFLLSALAA